MLLFLGILFIPAGLLCFVQVHKEFRSGTVTTRVGIRQKDRAPGTFWLSVFFECLVGAALLVAGGLCLLKLLK